MFIKKKTRKLMAMSTCAEVHYACDAEPHSSYLHLTSLSSNIHSSEQNL